ncbi:phytoene desaturase family protein [Cytobacillus spongiae]|jgi:phytoene desaturase|uniref:phytoene desaturase family protein n=1 Tax=Cytobacillus spongiae TaxID=2901381 RepID=UPI001F30C898|nr:phytoene desaturase family protein [Cytobacillus spongiae]UII56961.1 phytoene desaturase family protein [Cytobacillus spongiae]
MRAAIIGGGIGGLVTALLLSKQGHDVTILEKEARLGGRLGFVEKNGFKIDIGPTIVLLPEMLQDILTEAGINSDAYELIKCDPLYKIHFADQSAYTKYADMKKQEKEITSLSPDDLAGFRQFMKDMEGRFNTGKPKFLEKSFTRKRNFYNKETIKTLLEMKAFRDVYKQLSRYFSDERLRVSYALQTLYIGGNPLRTPAIYSLISYSEHKHGIYYLKGGYGSLVDVLEAELRKRKVTIHLDTKVQELHSTGSHVDYLMVNDERHVFDSYVVNGDFPVAERELLNREKSYTPSSGCLLFYFGLNKKYEDQMTHQFFIGSNFKQSMKEIFEKRELPTDPSYYTFYPSSIDSSLAPKGKSVLYVLVPVPSGSQIAWKETREFQEKILRRIEDDAFPNLREHVEWMKVRTPEDAEAEGLFAGGSFGIAPALMQSGVFRPQVKPFKEQNVYAVGASTHPGGGIPIVMQGAKLVAEEMFKETTTYISKEEVMTIG